MALAYGYVKATINKPPQLQHKRQGHEIQYHLHFGLDVDGQDWDVAINVGTNDSDDLLKYRLVFDFAHPVVQTLAAAAAGVHALTGQTALPALDFLRSDILANTGKWRDSDAMDGSDQVEPAASLIRLVRRAQEGGLSVYVFGRFYRPPDTGIHDTHMNQGSTGNAFRHTDGDDSNDHNDIWQDGAMLVALEEGQWAAYFAAFDQQFVPTDDLGNPAANAQPIGG